MSDLLDRLKAGKAAIGKVSLHGIQFGMRILSEQDYLSAGLAVEAAMKAAGIEFSTSSVELFEMEKSGQLLVRFLVDPVSGQPVAEDAESLRDSLSREEVAHLIEKYLEHERTVSPSERNMPEGELLKLFEAVKKTPETPLLNGLSSVTLRRLITILASPPST
ncbi:MAG: hypothetical protein WC825_09980 [Gallionellaceae bacterium]|jgi:hypothetical protein